MDQVFTIYQIADLPKKNLDDDQSPKTHIVTNDFSKLETNNLLHIDNSEYDIKAPIDYIANRTLTYCKPSAINNHSIDTINDVTFKYIDYAELSKPKPKNITNTIYKQKIRRNIMSKSKPINNIMPKPKISVLLPVYNNKDDIINAIDSVINQTLDDWELIIIDDHSTDGTINVIFEYLQKIPKKSTKCKIKIIRNHKNQGTYICLNTGLQYSSGKYICRIDSDDQWHLSLLEKQSKILDVNDQYIATQSMLKIDDGCILFDQLLNGDT